MLVTKRDGTTQEFVADKITAAIKRACDGLKDVNPVLLLNDITEQLYDGVTTEEIDKALVLAAKARIIYEPNYSRVAAKLLFSILYKEARGSGGNFTKQDYQDTFLKNLKTLSEVGTIPAENLAKFNLEELAAALVPERDGLFKYLGAQTLYDRYFLKVDGRRLETPQAFWMRVAMGLSLLEADPTKWAILFYEAFSKFEYCPSTPTLFNSCTKLSQLSSCFLSEIGDSIDGIFGGIHQQARLSKHAGGLGVSFSEVRGAGAEIKGTNGNSRGIVPWLKVFNDTLMAVDQGSKRKGAGCAYLEPWHVDILDFLDLLKNTGDERRRCHDIHTALWIPDLFMKKVEADEDWYLFCPNEFPLLHKSFCETFENEYNRAITLAEEGKVKVWSKLKAKELWRKILQSLRETGHPWPTFKDPSNFRYTDQHAGMVRSSNLCTEIIRHSFPPTYDRGHVVEPGETAVCNLASINLKSFTDPKTIVKWPELRTAIKLAMRGLDNVIDLNFYPIEDAELSNQRYRPVGLGLMGWADLLHTLQIPFDSDKAIELASVIQEYFSYCAIDASIELAQERGKYPLFEGSLWSEGVLPHDSCKLFEKHRGVWADTQNWISWDGLRDQLRKYGIRNGSVMAIAPTATIAGIMGCSQSIEADPSVLYVASTLSGDFTMPNEYFVERVKQLGLWSPELVSKLVALDGDIRSLELPDNLKDEFKPVFAINQHKAIAATAARGRYIDQSQSFNLYYDGNSMKEMSELYFSAWRKMLKTTYYFHTRAASKVEKSVDTTTICRIDNPNCESCQ